MRFHGSYRDLFEILDALLQAFDLGVVFRAHGVVHGFPAGVQKLTLDDPLFRLIPRPSPIRLLVDALEIGRCELLHHLRIQSEPMRSCTRIPISSSVSTARGPSFCSMTMTGFDV